MTPGRLRFKGLSSTKTPLREPDVAAGGDFVWPPPADDPAACSIVLLDTDAGGVRRARPTMLADDHADAFAGIDVETALDEFADPPVAPKVQSTTRPAQPSSPQGTQPPASRWRAAGLRSVVALCIGASLALAPPPGLTYVVDAQPLVVPAKVEPQTTAPRRLRTPRRVRVTPKPTTEKRRESAGPRDEDHIRTTLAQLRAAYGQLDAGAAREVWPSVDVDALARAFAGLTAQELRFDRCDVTVDGARAWAACTGEVVYVPRVEDSVSRSGARAWTFELTRMRERWMIASARAS